MGEILRKLRTDPIGLARRGVRKAIINRVRYRKGDGYDAHRYWDDRLGQYGSRSLQGVGDEGLTPRDNRAMYEQAGIVLDGVLDDLKVEWNAANVLEIGVGTGFFLDRIVQRGPEKYTAVDITDVLFGDIARRHPNVSLMRADISETSFPQVHNLVLFIDVIEHIVEDARFAQALGAVRDATLPGGAIIIGPVTSKTKRCLAHTRFWSLDDISAHFPGWTISDVIPFRYSGIITLRKPASAT